MVRGLRMLVKDIYDEASDDKGGLRLLVKDIYDGVSDGKGVENACQRHL